MRKAIVGGHAKFDLATMQERCPPVEHPVVVTHPETGRRGLFVNRNSTTQLVGLSERENDVLLPFLFDHVRSPEYQCRFHWEPGSMAFWDNRCVQHYAVADYTERRVMHRVTSRRRPAARRADGRGDAVPVRARARRPVHAAHARRAARRRVPAPVPRPLRPPLHRLLGGASAAARGPAAPDVADRAQRDRPALVRWHDPDPRPAGEARPRAALARPERPQEGARRVDDGRAPHRGARRTRATSRPGSACSNRCRVWSSNSSTVPSTASSRC